MVINIAITRARYVVAVGSLVAMFALIGALLWRDVTETSRFKAEIIKNDKQLCRLLYVLRQPEGPAPSTERGKEINNELNRLYILFECEDK